MVKYYLSEMEVLHLRFNSLKFLSLVLLPDCECALCFLAKTTSASDFKHMLYGWLFTEGMQIIQLLIMSAGEDMTTSNTTHHYG